jgi:5-methylcytosine-specific restriction endonuclease McrA
MTDKEIAQARRMQEEGIPYRKISAAMDIPRSTIYRTLKPEYYETHGDCNRLRAAKWLKTHKKEKRLYDVKYRENHEKESRCYSAEYRKTHKEEMHLYYARWLKNHKDDPIYQERRRETVRKWSKTHLPERAAESAIRRALVAGATIGNLTEIKEIYRQAKEEPKVRCYLCGKLIPMGHRHVDHICPVSKGGAHRPSNLAVACDKCNLSKHDKRPEEIGILI